MGIWIEKDIISILDEYVQESAYLGVTRSEIINAILKMYIDSDYTPKKNLS